MKSSIFAALLGLALLTTASSAQAGVMPSSTLISQYANSVIGFSSEYSDTEWAADQALGAPDTFDYGDIETAWAPHLRNGGMQSISVGFQTQVFANQVTIRETWGNGFVRRLDVIDSNDSLHKVWAGVDDSLPGRPVNFTIDFAQTSFLVKGVKVYVDTNHNRNTWEEIDSIEMVGTSSTPEPASLAIFGIGALGLMACRRKKRKSRPETL